MINKRVCFLFCLLIVTISAQSQEYLDGLEVNPVLLNQPQTAKFKSSVMDTLHLPFIDDFSYNSIYPTSNLWDDKSKSVFINNSYGICPYSIGVATFDAVSDNGEIYSTASEEPFDADYLTSLLIDISEANLNSLILSFYYQPQGNGNAPEKGDSLILQFDANHTANWKTVWAAPGTSYKSFVEDSLHITTSQTDMLQFKYVEIPITDQKYRNKNFRFRFRNKASIATSSNPSAAINCDHWNLDFVYLNEHRKAHEDTNFYDVCFTKSTISILKNFTAIPWAHYNTDVINTENTRINPTVRNNWNQLLSEDIDIYIRDTAHLDTFIYRQSPGSQDLQPKKNISLFGDQIFNDNPIKPDSRSSACFVVEHCLRDPDDIISSNDTARTYQYFGNYYAFDDGTAENAYGIDADGAKVAYLFNTYVGDSLNRFDIYFLQCKGDAAAKSFYPCVWEEQDGLPGKLRVKTKEAKSRPTYGTQLNQFVTVELDTTIYISGKFFIGWEQTSSLRMNVGWDVNKIYLKDKLFYNTTGSWQATSFGGKGVLMLRPVFGSSSTSSVKENTSNTENISVFPNPASTGFNIAGIEQNQTGSVILYNSLGAIVRRWQISSSSYDISGLPAGLYFVSINTMNQPAQVLKLIKNQ
jgi:hypothetical protein